MHRIIRAAVFGVLLVGVAPRAEAQREEQISPSITLTPRVDPIEDKDLQPVRRVVRIRTGGRIVASARLSISCLDIHRTGLVAYETPVVGATHLIWRFDTHRPDTLELHREHPMRTYGGGGVWMVMYKPLEIIVVSDSVVESMVRDGARASRLVVRLVGPRMQHDSYFSLTGFSRAASRLSCLQPAAQARRDAWWRALPPIDSTQTIYYDHEYVDVDPVPLDSAGTVLALRRAVSPADLADAVLGYVLAWLEVSAAGEVDTAEVVSSLEAGPAIERFLRSIRFRPGPVNGVPVPTRVPVYIQREDPGR